MSKVFEIVMNEVDFKIEKGNVTDGEVSPLMIDCTIKCVNVYSYYCIKI